MDKIEKLLRQFSAKEREAMLLLMQQIKHDHRKIPGVKQLKGKDGWYRVRIGRYRIVFVVDPRTKRVEIRRVTKRDEDTYKRLQ